MAQYGKTDYWQQRYTRDPEPFDWYQRYNGLKEVITPNISQNSQILNVGCGNSRLSQQMVDDGYAHITNIDVSVVVIQQMIEKHKEAKFANMKYLRMDVRSMGALEKGSFDCVIDKGTFDSILCGEGSDTNAEKMLSEIYRVLSPTGVYICISYGIPEQRQNYFRSSGLKWDITIQKVPKPTISTSTMSAADDKEIKSFHYIYIMKKTGQV